MKKYYITPDLNLLRIDLLTDALSNSTVNENQNIDISDFTEPAEMPTPPGMGDETDIQF